MCSKSCVANLRLPATCFSKFHFIFSLASIAPNFRFEKRQLNKRYRVYLCMVKVYIKSISIEMQDFIQAITMGPL